MATSAMTWAQFQAIPNGTKVFNHGWDECVALANLYHESVLGKPFVAVGSAYQWWTLFRNYPALYNTYKQSGAPVAGAVVVSRYGIYDSPNGHIEVVTSVNPDGSFNTMGQNASGHRYVWRYRRTMQNILGFLHPYNNPANQAPTPNEQSQEDDDMAQNAGIAYIEGGKQINAIVNTTSGYFGEYEATGGGYNNPIAAAFATGSFATVSKSHFEAIRRQCAEVRAKK